MMDMTDKVTGSCLHAATCLRPRALGVAVSCLAVHALCSESMEVLQGTHSALSVDHAETPSEYFFFQHLAPPVCSLPGQAYDSHFWNNGKQVEKKLFKGTFTNR